MIKKTIYYESQTITTSGNYTFKCKSLMFSNIGPDAFIDTNILLKPGDSLTLDESDYEINHSFNIQFSTLPGKLAVLISKIKVEI